MVAAKLPFDRRAIPARAIEATWNADDGWPLRRIDWLQPETARGSLLFLSGRADHYEKYLETLDQFADERWLVTAMDWRGQGGSGRFLVDRHVGDIDDFSTWISDLKAFWADWKATRPGPHVILAHSMGGHLTIRALFENTIDPDAVALSAPMLGLKILRLPAWMQHIVVRFLASLGNPARAAWKESAAPVPVEIQRRINLTHDSERYADERYWWQARPEVKLGPPSWRWLERAIASTRILNKSGALESLQTPVLIMASTADKLVDTNRSIRDARRMPNAEILLFGKEAAHELLRESNPVRDKCMSAIRAFFDKHAPRP